MKDVENPNVLRAATRRYIYGVCTFLVCSACLPSFQESAAAARKAKQVQCNLQILSWWDSRDPST